MENRSHALMAGIFALGLGAAMVWAIWWFSGERELTRDYLLVSKGNIGSLNVQATVRYRGMLAGKVTDIRLDQADPRLILITINIREDLPVSRGTWAILDSQGVTGIAFIQLEDRGDDPRPLTAPPGELPRLELEPSIFSRISDAVLDAMYGLDAIANQLQGFLGEDNRHRLEGLFQRLEAIAGGVEDSLGELPATLQAVQGLLSRENLARVENLLAYLEEAGSEAAPAVVELRELLASLGGMGQRLEEAADEVRGDLQAAGDELRRETLPKVEELLTEAAAASRRLGRLLEELESSPQLLLRGRQQEPGPGEEGFKW